MRALFAMVILFGGLYGVGYLIAEEAAVNLVNLQAEKEYFATSILDTAPRVKYQKKNIPPTRKRHGDSCSAMVKRCLVKDYEAFLSSWVSKERKVK